MIYHKCLGFLDDIYPQRLLPWQTYKLCRNKTTIILVVVTSKPQNFEQRMVIRNTWSKTRLVNSGDVVIMFLLGSEKNEAVFQNQLQVKGNIKLNG